MSTFHLASAFFPAPTRSGSHIRVPTEANSSIRATEVMNRQAALKTIALIPIIWSQGTSLVEAKVSIKPDGAFNSLLKAREELQTVSKEFLSNKDYEGMREFLRDGALNINNYEENANVLLTSKQLDAESKKEIGTIRRYGVGADVIISFGGLKAEINEENESPDYSTVSKSLQRTMDSLDEVISICRSNGF